MVPGHPSTARWVPSTPHRSRPAGHPTNRQPCAVGAEEREYDEGRDVEADGERRRPQSAARRRRSVGQLRRPTPQRRQAATEGLPRHRLPRRHTPAPTTTSCAGSQISCRKRTAPPPSRCSKDVTAHPHRPGGRPGRPCPAPVRSGRHRPVKGRSNPHTGTEFFQQVSCYF